MYLILQFHPLLSICLTYNLVVKSADIVRLNSKLLAPSRNCNTHHQALLNFGDMSQLSRDRNNDIDLLYYKGLINMLSLVPFKYF